MLCTCNFNELFVAVPQLPTSSNQQRLVHGKGFPCKYGPRSKWGIEEEIPRLRIFPVVKAASSSSPPLGGSSSEYSEQLLGAEVVKKKSSVAGIDQDELRDPIHLADPDSRFCKFRGVNLHYKICEPDSAEQSSSQEQNFSQFHAESKRLAFPMILLHGFGASVFSWNRVMKHLSRITGSKVLAFDRPAFGLTSRISYSEYARCSGEENSMNPYSMKFSVLATRYFIDFLVSEKAILVGHSAGSLTALGTYFDAPERVAALILVAPAILAPGSAKKDRKKEQEDLDDQIKESNSVVSSQTNFFVRLGQILSRVFGFIAVTVGRLAKGMMDMVNAAYKKVASAILSSTIAVTLVRMIIAKFGISAIRNAWYDASQVTDDILQGYTKPLRCQGWDKALVEYTVAMLTDSAGDSEPPLSKRLNEIACPVLIVTGDSDRLVPSWNSERLARAIPNSHFELIKNCGHLPHEEKPEEFTTLVQNFLQKTVFAGSEDFCMQMQT